MEAEAEFIILVLQHLLVAQEEEEMGTQVLLNQQLDQPTQVVEVEAQDGCLVLLTQAEMAAQE